MITVMEHPKVIGYSRWCLKVAKFKSLETGKVSEPPLYVIPVCPETPFWAKIMAFGAALALVAIVIMALQTLIRASKIGDKARQVLSAGILTTVAGMLTILVEVYSHLYTFNHHYLVINSFIPHAFVAAAGIMMGIGGIMILLGLALSTYRRLTL
ncbi:hypothetical protein [Methanopyrus sp.]